MKTKQNVGRSLRMVLATVSLTLIVLIAFMGVLPAASLAGPGQGKAKGDHQIRLVPPKPVPTTSRPQKPVKAIKPGRNAAQAPSAGAAAGAAPSAAAAAAAVSGPIDMKLLVISADGKEPGFPAVKAFLDQIGVPYDTLVGTSATLTASKLSDGANRGYYQGIILITGNLGYDAGGGNWQSAFDSTEWQVLWQYEAKFGVRQVTAYTYPGGYPEDYGLQLVTYQDTTNSPLQASLTTEGRKVFSYLNPNNPITFRYAWVYLATVADAAGTTPLLVTSQGYPIASVHKAADGRENLTVTSDHNPDLMHSMLLSYGMINWVTKGLFLGERHVNMNVQVDDMLLDDDMWDINALSDTTGLTFRMSGTDFTQAIAWQSRARAAYPSAANLRLDLAFNGEGATDIWDFPDTLTPAVKANQSAFGWVNHTFDHPNLDYIGYTAAMSQLTRNHSMAVNTLRFTNYFKDAFVQPDISGLSNPNFLRAARDFGLKYLISDTSQPGWNNPTPNAGFYSAYQPSLLIIPRRPSNLFYNLRTPEEWVSSYNCYFGPNATCAGGQWKYWTHNLTYQEILEVESDALLSYMLKWDLDPLMFHQPNLGTFDGTNSLLGVLYDKTLQKYSAAYNLPIRNNTEHNTGILMARRMAYNAAKVKGSLVPCQSMTLVATRAALVPITGVSYGTNREAYGGQDISYIQLAANVPVTVPLPACP